MAAGSSDDPYTLLGIDAGADAAELRRAWRRLALQWHPDRAGAASTAIFQKLRAAYAVVSDPAARAAYDRRRGTPARSPAARTTPASAPAATRRSAPGEMLHRQG